MSTRRMAVATFGCGDCGRLGLGKPMINMEIPTFVAALCGVQASSICAGAAHTAVVADDGIVFTFGLNDMGQLGHSKGNPEVSEPLEVSTVPERIIDVAAGDRHTLALAESGNVWSWGCNERGQLGLGSDIEISEPRVIRALEGNKIVAIAAGSEHSLAISSSGEVFSWGCGDDGRLGHKGIKAGHTRDEFKPRMLRSFEATVIRSASAGQMHSACVSAEGQAYVFGSNRYFQLGQSTDSNAEIPVRVPNLPLVREIACGSQHSLASLLDGSVAAFGANFNGSLGIGSQPAPRGRGPVTVPGLRALSVAAGWKHSAAIDADGKLYTWGWGGSQGTALSFEEGGGTGGQLGHGDDNDRWDPGLVEWVKSSADGPEVIPSQMWKAVKVSCGLQHTVALISIGE